jgi:hypothetical protein
MTVDHNPRRFSVSRGQNSSDLSQYNNRILVPHHPPGSQQTSDLLQYHYRSLRQISPHFFPHSPASGALLIHAEVNGLNEHYQRVPMFLWRKKCSVNPNDKQRMITIASPVLNSEALCPWREVIEVTEEKKDKNTI